MGRTDVTSGGSTLIPHGCARDADGIPYVLVQSGNSLTMYKGNAATPTSWSSASVGTLANGGYTQTTAMCLYDYGGTEYLIVAYNDNWDLKTKRAPISTFTFASAVTVDTDNVNNYSPSFAYDDTGDDLLIHYTHGGYDTGIRLSTDGGASWGSRTEAWNDSDWIHSTGAAWDGSHFHLLVGRETTWGPAWTKRYSTGAGLQYWNGSSWASSTASNMGLDTNVLYFKGMTTIGKASSNILVFSHCSYGTKQNIIYSLNGGQSFSTVGSMGAENYCYGDVCLRDETGLVDDLAVLATNYDSNQNDTNYNLYDYSGSSWGGWTLHWDSADTSDTVRYTCALPYQILDFIDFAYEHYDADLAGGTYIVVHDIYQTGTVPGAAGEIQLIVDGGVHQLLVDGGITQKIVD